MRAKKEFINGMLRNFWEKDSVAKFLEELWKNKMGKLLKLQ
jgi:hypothetical protein